MAAAEERGLFAQTLFRWAAINPAAEGNSNIACSVSWWLTLRPSRLRGLIFWLWPSTWLRMNSW